MFKRGRAAVLLLMSASPTETNNRERRCRSTVARLPNRIKVLILLVCLTAPLAAADHVWQSGTLRDPTGQVPVKPGATYGVPAGATTIFLSDPPEEHVMIDAPDGISYVASRKGHRKAPALVINDPVTFAIEGDALYVRLGDHDTKYKIVKRLRKP